MAIEISLEDVYLGATKKMTISRYRTCSSCKGFVNNDDSGIEINVSRAAEQTNKTNQVSEHRNRA